MCPDGPRGSGGLRPPEADAVSATEAQNNFGRILARAVREGEVLIEKYDRPAAVLLSPKRYRELTSAATSEMEELSRRFDQLLARVQDDDSADAADTLFEMDSEELGAAAVREVRRESE